MLFEQLALWLAGLHRSRPSAKAMSWEAWQRIRRKDWSGARFLARVAVASDPSWADGYRMLGYAHCGAQDLSKARSTLRRGLTAAPEDLPLIACSESSRLKTHSWRVATIRRKHRQRRTPAIELRRKHSRCPSALVLSSPVNGVSVRPTDSSVDIP